jgi:hypothetical protein
LYCSILHICSNFCSSNLSLINLMGVILYLCLKKGGFCTFILCSRACNPTINFLELSFHVLIFFLCSLVVGAKQIAPQNIVLVFHKVYHAHMYAAALIIAKTRIKESLYQNEIVQVTMRKKKREMIVTPIQTIDKCAVTKRCRRKITEDQ